MCTAKYSQREAENLEKMVPNELFNCIEINTSLLRQWVLTGELRSYFFPLRVRLVCEARECGANALARMFEAKLLN